MRLKLTRNINSLVWELDGVETELWKQPPDPLLEKVSQLLTADKAKWIGAPVI